MRDAVIVDAVRSPVGRRNGLLSGVHPADLAATVLRSLADRTGLELDLVDDAVFGCVSQVGEQASNIARTAVLSAGWPISVAGTTVDRQCGSSQQAVQFAAASVIAGQYEFAVAGGVESMTRLPMGSAARDGQSSRGPGYERRFGSMSYSQFDGAHEIAVKSGLERSDLDEFAAKSHEKAAAATREGLFVGELASVPGSKGDHLVDEGIRPATTVHVLAGLRSIHQGGLLTAGNSSQISDASAALLITTSDLAAKHGLTPMARIHTSIVMGSEPRPMLSGPIPATAKVLKRSGLSLDDIGVFECNEAFAAVVLAWQSEYEIDPTLINPNGGAIAIGHPLGASGARIMTTMVHHMRRQGIRYGLQTMCEGGGQANATILELV